MDVSSQPSGMSEDAGSRPRPKARYRRLRRADLELIAVRHLAGASDGAIARELGVDRSSVRRARKRPACLELIAAERKREAKRAESRRYRARKKEQREQTAPALPEAEGKGEREPRGLASASPTWVGGVPLFPDTPGGQAARFAYYEARKLSQLPNSLLDYHDVLHGRETPAERRAREGGASARR